MRFWQPLAFIVGVIFAREGWNAEGFWVSFWWYLAASLSAQVFVSLIKNEIKKEQNA